MSRQTYSNGQVVRVAAESLTGPSTDADFRVVRRYRMRGAPDFYRLQSMVNPSERMVPENELTAMVAGLGRSLPLLPDASLALPTGSRQSLQAAA